MKISSEADPGSKPSSDPFDDRIATLLEEIQLAIKWDRPSILLAVYSSEIVNNQAQEALRKQIEMVGQKVTQIKVNKENFDIPWFLAQFEQHDQVVFFISGFRWGGGRSRTYAYQALNMRRELFVDEKIRMVIWLNEKEASDLPHHAPDFWAFRHRVVEFHEESIIPADLPVSDMFSWWDWQVEVPAENLKARITKRESALVAMPAIDATLLTRIQSMHTLAYLYWVKRDYAKTASVLEKALALTSNPLAESLQGKILNDLGIYYHGQNKLETAAAIMQKALEKDAGNASTWNILGRVLQDQGRSNDGLKAYKKALKLDPKDACAWNNLGNNLRASGQFQDALYAYKQASRLEPLNPIPWVNTAHAQMDAGQPDKAIRAFKKTTRLDANNVHAWQNLGDIYREMNRLEEAIAAYNKALKIGSGQILVHGGLAACYRMLGRPEAVKKQIRLAIQVMKGHNEKTRAEFETLCGNNKEALQLLVNAVAMKQVTRQAIRSNLNFNGLHNEPQYKMLMEVNR